MNKRTVVVAVVVGLGMMQSALAGDWIVSKGQWYFSPMAGMNFEDKSRHADPGPAASLGLGRQFAESWAVELSLFGGRNRGFNEFRPVGVGVDFLLDVNRSGIFSPYLVFGTGFVRADIVEHPIVPVELNYDSVIGTAGFGVIAPLGNAATRFRTEVRYRADFKSPGFNDLLVMVGLYVPLGHPTPPAVRTAPFSKPDADGDGVDNDTDMCPATPKGIVVDPFGCELDSDGDGVANLIDDCPTTPSGTRVGRRGCSLAAEQRDDDGDGVVNNLDSCRNTAAGARIDIRGCEIDVTISLPGIRFALNSAQLISTSTLKLDHAAATLRANPGLKVEAAGHTDSSGSAATNLDLSQRRAESVRQYLISRGANSENITARGYGEANPIADNSTRTGRQENRRVELRVLN
ncbi:MAG: OmpA family protein [Gammaproteobacteria bacterium]|nr:OmpA family protein [Gammaproteobacteria bacterium]MDH3767367.1 OmpA family protein [Gammaproteobacteria bacterium]